MKVARRHKKAFAANVDFTIRHATKHLEKTKTLVSIHHALAFTLKRFLEGSLKPMVCPEVEPKELSAAQTAELKVILKSCRQNRLVSIKKRVHREPKVDSLKFSTSKRPTKGSPLDLKRKETAHAAQEEASAAATASLEASPVVEASVVGGDTDSDSE